MPSGFRGHWRGRGARDHGAVVGLNERTPARSRLRVLILDDEPEIAEVAAEFLERHGGSPWAMRAEFRGTLLRTSGRATVLSWPSHEIRAQAATANRRRSGGERLAPATGQPPTRGLSWHHATKVCQPKWNFVARNEI